LNLSAVCAAALKIVQIADRQECRRRLNNQAESVDLPLRRRAAAMARFRGMKRVQKFAASLLCILRP